MVSQLDLESIHRATLSLLGRTGIAVRSPLALSLLVDHGVRVDMAAQRAYPGEADVAAALSTVPRSFAVYGRHEDAPRIVGGDNVSVLSGGGSVRVLTLEGVYEPSTWEHLRRFNVLLDALPNIHMMINQVDPPDDGGQGVEWWSGQDLDGERGQGKPCPYYRRLAATMLTGSPKPCNLQAGSAADVEAFVAMGVALRGSAEALRQRPVFMVGSNAEPPLHIPAHAAEIQVAASRAGVPCGIGDYLMMGITGPVTVAGAAVEINAVQLTALVLSQAARAGAPFPYTAFSGGGNLRTLDPLTSSPQALRLLGLAARMGRWYGLPVYSTALTDAKAADAQAACERVLQLRIAVDAGANIIQGPTSHMDQMMLSSYAQAVIDDEIVGYVLATRGDPEVSEDTLALEALHDVATDPSYDALKFAAHPHTARHCRDDVWEPEAFVYDSFTAWKQSGARSVIERAEDKARHLLASHRPEPLPDNMVAEIRGLAAEGDTAAIARGVSA
ncbi:MAG: trimethylamine methyltransferase family protein [Anaerolineae bacterium]